MRPLAIDALRRSALLAASLPGIRIRLTHGGKIVLEKAYGHADLGRGIELTPRHRFRVASGTL